MKRSALAGGALAVVVFLIALGVALRTLGLRRPSNHRAAIPVSGAAFEETHESFLYGRVATVDDAVFEGRLRWGGSQEAFWGDYFNGAKKGNPWAAHVPPERLPKERHSIRIFGLEFGERENPAALNRLFMARYGDIAGIEAAGREVRVTLKSGTTFVLDRFSASDFDDGLRVWDATRGVTDLDSLRIGAIGLRSSPSRGVVPHRLYGTVQTAHGAFTGFLQWNREECLGSDELDSRTAEGKRSFRFDTVRSIERHSSDSSRVTLIDGRAALLSGTNEAGEGNRGVYVDDARYGRVLVSWDAFRRVDFSSGGGAGPAYGDFPPGGPLTGAVTTRGGRRLAGRLVYDLDETEVTETLDAPSQGVTYTIPFGLIAAIANPAAEGGGAQSVMVTLHSGERLHLERAGDLGPNHAGILVFSDGRERPEYVPWAEVERVDLNRPHAMFPEIGRAR
ncbi:MAG TPA: hypothetical protein DEH78_16185 [Solibacterales bacterium]|nr:hypothetical protein [Bryobacterales bacterium]